MKPFVLYLDATLAEIREQVAAHLPYLRLRISNTAGHELDEEQAARPLHDLAPGAKTSFLVVALGMTVADLEAAWQTAWGLRAEVFRRNGYTWVDTDYTKNWTLREQNEKGEAALDNP